MAITDFKNQMCNKYTTNTLRASRQLNNLHKLTRGPYNALRNTLFDLKSKPTTSAFILQQKLNVLSGEMQSQVPDLLSNKSDLARMAEACTPFKNLIDGKGSLTDAIGSVVDATNNLIQNVVLDAANTLMSNVEEYASGAAMSALDAMFGNIKIPDILGNLDPLLNCLDNMCPGHRTSQIIDQVNQIQSDMGFTDEGKFDAAKIMQEVGMPSDKQANLNSIGSIITDTTAKAQESASNQVSSLFSSIKKAKKSSVANKISSFF